jgi:hypothetical protein
MYALTNSASIHGRKSASFSPPASLTYIKCLELFNISCTYPFFDRATTVTASLPRIPLFAFKSPWWMHWQIPRHPRTHLLNSTTLQPSPKVHHYSWMQHLLEEKMSLNCEKKTSLVRWKLWLWGNSTKHAQSHSLLRTITHGITNIVLNRFFNIS